MEPRARDKIIAGGFVFVGLFLLAASIFLLGQRGRYFAPQHRLRAAFTNVAGLHEGATVRLAGVAVGRVTRIRLPAPPARKVLVELRVAGDAIDDVRRDSVARLETMGILGDKFIEITVGSPREPRLQDGGTLVVEETADFAALIGQGQRALAHAERLAASLEQGAGALPWLVNDPESKRLVTETLSSVHAVAVAAERGDGAVSWMLQDPASRRLAQDLGHAAETLATLADEIKDGRGLAHALIYDPEGGKVLEQVSQTIEDVQALVGAIRTGDGAISALINDPASRELLTNLTKVSQRLDEISAKLARGEGTLGALLADPTVYEDLTALLEGAQRSRILRWGIRHTLESGRAARKERMERGE